MLREMKPGTDDLRIAKVRPLLSPAVLAQDIPLSEGCAAVTREARSAIEGILLGEDSRLLVIVGPPSIHEPDAAVELARRLERVARELESALLVVMRVQFERPRTAGGYEGLIRDPDLDGSYHINQGLRVARQLLIDITSLGMPAATEFLDTTLGQFYADAISWGAIGGGTAGSPVHRELISGLSMPVGVESRADGDVEVALEAIEAARHRHLFPSLTKEGAPAILETRGNDTAHLVLCGSTPAGGPAAPARVERAAAALAARGLPPVVLVRASHGDGRTELQREVAFDVAAQLEAGSHSIRGLILESHLVGGRQDLVSGRPLVVGQSITDPCLSLDESRPILDRLAEAALARAGFR